MLSIELNMPVIRVLVQMIPFITGGFHPQGKILNTTSHRPKRRLDRIVPIEKVRNISEEMNKYVVYSLDVLNL